MDQTQEHLFVRLTVGTQRTEVNSSTIEMCLNADLLIDFRKCFQQLSLRSPQLYHFAVLFNSRLEHRL